MNNTQEDCYFFINSTCIKGDRCTFRHCEAAKRSKRVCRLWLQDRCFNRACRFRHTDIRKVQREIQCHWETQGGVCQKQHCNYKHRKPWARRRRPARRAQEAPEEKVNKIPPPSDVTPGQKYKESGSVCPADAEEPCQRHHKNNNPRQCKKLDRSVLFNKMLRSIRCQIVLPAKADEIDFIIKAMEELKLEDGAKTHLRTAGSARW